MASNAASKASSTAANMKDSVFSMFGGGAKKEKKDEDEVDEPSGSSKAKKDVDAEEVCPVLHCKISPPLSLLYDVLKFSSSQDDAEREPDVHFEPVVHLTEKVDAKPTRSKRNKHSKCGPSSSSLTVRVESGRNVVQAM